MKEINIDELITFATSHPWKTIHPKSLIARFLTELISSSKCIYDIRDGHGRVALAVLIDKINNPGNDACLELLGLRPGADSKKIYRELVTLVKNQVPSDKNGVQFEEVFEASFLSELGLIHYYDAFSMKRDFKEIECADYPEITKANLSHCDEIYEVLCQSFKENVDTSIPDKITWQQSYGKKPSPYSEFHIWKKSGRILGFAHFILEENNPAEIRTIGVLPEVRGQGIGKALLDVCLNESQKLGSRECTLTVAVKNLKALDLYLKSGFVMVEKSGCYRYEKVKS